MRLFCFGTLGARWREYVLWRNHQAVWPLEPMKRSLGLDTKEWSLCRSELDTSVLQIEVLAAWDCLEELLVVDRKTGTRYFAVFEWELLQSVSFQ